MPSPSIQLQTDAQKLLGMVCYDRSVESEIIVHEVSHLAALSGGDAPALDGGVLLIDRQFKTITEACVVYPEKQTLQIEKKENHYAVKLPDVSIHQVIQIKYEE